MSLRDYFIAPAQETQTVEQPDGSLGTADGGEASGVPSCGGFGTADSGEPAGVPGRGRFALRRARADPPRLVVAPSLGVLAAARDLPAVAAAAGLVIARGAPAALVCVHAPDAELAAPLRAPARPAAARLATSLDVRGVPAEARGRLVLVGGELADAMARALAAAGVLPTVLAIAVRAPEVDALLAERDAILIALPPSADPALVDLALAGATELSRPVASLAVALDPVSRALALGGLRAPPRLGDAVKALLA
jgi:hypothetical protein